MAGIAGKGMEEHDRQAPRAAIVHMKLAGGAFNGLCES